MRWGGGVGRGWPDLPLGCGIDQPNCEGHEPEAVVGAVGFERAAGEQVQVRWTLGAVAAPGRHGLHLEPPTLLC